MFSNADCAIGLLRRKTMSERSILASLKNDMLHSSSIWFSGHGFAASHI